MLLSIFNLNLLKINKYSVKRLNNNHKYLSNK